MKPARRGLTISLGAGALASVGYASAVGLTRRQPSHLAADEEVEAILEVWLGELGHSAIHRYVQTAAGRVHALEIGQGPRSLLLLHGPVASLGEYAALAARLGTRFRVVGMDRPGSGLSDPIRFEGHPRPVWNQVGSAVLDQLGVDQFDLVGRSLGAWPPAATLSTIRTGSGGWCC